MKRAPTLSDTLYRASFKNERVMGWANNAAWRAAIRDARRFVLDDPMSTFLGELSTRAFAAKGNMGAITRNRMIENLRVGARLPHATTWIEYNLRNSQARSNELLGRKFNPMETPKYEGWLLQQHPGIETAFIAHIITHDVEHDHGDGFDTWSFPVALAWTADQETVLPWRAIPFSQDSAAPSEIATGILGYKTDKASYVFSNMLVTPNAPKAIANLMQEWGGVLRRIWALLSTINDLPVQVTEVRQPKGFVARGEYRKFLDHKTLTLTVPAKHYTKIARNALAMAHRRGGPVRAHWRLDWRHPLSPLCEHEFSADEKHMFCLRCKGRKIHIKAHERGDSSRGFMTLDYRVTHPEEPNEKAKTIGQGNPDLPVRPDSTGGEA